MKMGDKGLNLPSQLTFLNNHLHECLCHCTGTACVKMHSLVWIRAVQLRKGSTSLSKSLPYAFWNFNFRIVF